MDLLTLKEGLNSNFQEKLDRIFSEFKSSSANCFLLETKNREMVFLYFEEKLKEVEDFRESLFINLKVFDVSKAREIIEYGNTGFSKKHFILISFYSITRESQNALLKFLEESGENLKILFIVHEGLNLISTILSRLYKLEIHEEKILSENAENEFLLRAAEKFLTTKKIQRMKIKEISQILEKKDEYALEFENKERADRESLEKFLICIHDFLAKDYENFILESVLEEKDLEVENKFKMFNYQNKEFLDDISDVIEAIKYSKNNSSSGKTLLEYLSLKLPEISN
ncbi:MAG TPA: hypothetical protein PLE26_00190 [Candidatus Paceibacterota bacterium]|nr:hypothetical protein [Candidatus Paceibacterota bacterium]HQB57064.1 hypothetical protein [Candidatus Paceibacterota bacterium]